MASNIFEKDKIDFYKNNLDVFIEDNFNGIKLSDVQRKILKAFSKKKSRVSVHAGRGVGKSFLISLIVMSLILLYDEIMVSIVTSNIGTLKDSVFHHMYKNQKKMGKELLEKIEILSELVRQKNNFASVAKIVGYKDGAEDSIKGRHDKELVMIIDEAANVSRKAMDAAYFSLTEGNNKMLLLGNPNKSHGYFYDTLYKRNFKNAWDGIIFSIYDAKDYVDAVSIAEMEAMYPENSDTRRVNMLGLPPTRSKNAFFASSDIEGKYNLRDVSLENILNDPFIKGKILIGITIGDSWNPTVISYRYENLCFPTKHIIEPDNRKIVQFVANNIKVENIKCIVIGFSSINIFLKNELKKISNKIIFLEEYAITQKKIRNQKTLCYHNMQQWIYSLESGADVTINDLDVIDSIIAIEGEYDTNGGLKIRDSEEYNEHGGNTFNFSDSLAYTFLFGNNKVKNLKESKHYSSMGGMV